MLCTLLLLELQLLLPGLLYHQKLRASITVYANTIGNITRKQMHAWMGPQLPVEGSRVFGSTHQTGGTRRPLAGHKALGSTLNTNKERQD
jgi:hypothetical protein